MEAEISRRFTDSIESGNRKKMEGKNSFMEARKRVNGKLRGCR